MSKQKKISFVNHQGLELAARLEFPVDQHPVAFVIFAHCFTCNKNLAAVRHIAKALTSSGLAVLRFDFAGLGESEGTFVTSNFSTNITDILAAAEYLKEDYQPPTLIIGHSLGGAAALVAARQLPSVKGVATIGAPADPTHVTHLLRGAITEIERQGQAEVQIGGRTFTIAKHFLEDLHNHDLQQVIGSLRKALLILHAPFDRTVGIDNARMIYQAARHPKSFISLDGADHILSAKEDSQYAGDVIATWAKRYLTPQDEKKLPSNSQVVASLSSGDKFSTYLKAGRHRMIGDEPESVGGDNFGPSPYEFVAAGLAACTAMTLHMYARRKKWDLQEVIVHVDHQKIHAKDCENCTEDEKANSDQRMDQMTRELQILGNLDSTQVNRLLEIANRCPVHRTLESKSDIVTRVLVSD